MWKGVVVAALAAVAVRLSFLHLPVGSDEAGLLMIAEQWAPGSSLYGDYWIDRPPGLIAVVAVADALGGSVALRLIGAISAGAAVLAAAWLGARLAPRHRSAPAVCAIAVAALVSNPLLDVDEISAEILALPLLLAGLAAVVTMTRSAFAMRWAVAAGAAGAAAALLKQNLVEVWLAMAVVVLAYALRGEGRRGARLLGGFLGGAVLVAGPLLILAWERGTTIADIWDAIVVFRIQAGDVIVEGASKATPDRARRLALAFLATGMPVLLVLLTRLRWRTPPQNDDAEYAEPSLSWVCLVLLLWEAIGVATGGSYWLHYLLLPVPGLTFLLAATLQEPRGVRADTISDRWFPGWVVAPLVASAMIGMVVVVVEPLERPSEDQAVIDFLRANREQGSTAVVAFGNPALLHSADMDSPYEYLWSLLVRVRDPHLRELIRVLSGPGRPQWVVQVGESLTTWGIDASHADRVLDRFYRPVYENDDYTIFARRS
jgi:hypothetical protein